MGNQFKWSRSNSIAAGQLKPMSPQLSAAVEPVCGHWPSGRLFDCHAGPAPGAVGERTGEPAAPPPLRASTLRFTLSSVCSSGRASPSAAALMT